MNQRKMMSLWLFFAFAILSCGIMSLWQLYEQDTFWQVRAGYEILNGHGLQRTDEWSYTATGTPWVNIEWLSAIILSAAFSFAGAKALIMMRAISAMIILLIASVIVCREINPRFKPMAAIITVLLGFLLMSFRFEIRAELFVLVVFACLIWVLRSRFSPRARIVIAFIACLISANLHAGLTPFLILVSASFALSAPGLKPAVRIITTISLCLTVLCTPYGWQVLPVLWKHFDYTSFYILENFDQRPLSLSLDILGIAGLSPWVWVIWAILSAWALWQQISSKDEPTSAASRFIPLVVGLTLIGLCINRIRVIPFHFLFFLPYVAHQLNIELYGSLKRHSERPRSYGVSSAACIVVLVGLIAAQRQFMPLSYGLKASKSVFPVGSAEFVNTVKPEKNVLHPAGFGAYLVWFLRDYPLFVDPRQTMYEDLQKTMLAMADSPSGTRSVCAQYNINTAIMPIAAMRYTRELGFEDPTFPYFPPEEWAVVYFDDSSVVHLRRIPEHKKIIAENEFTILKPHMPVSAYLQAKSRTSESDRRFADEVARCRRQEPENLHCAVAQSALWRESRIESNLASAYSLMASLKPKGWGNPEYMLELISLCNTVHRFDEAKAAEKALQP